MWREIRARFDSPDLDYPKLRIYQDGLPVCGREAEIVMELAGAGSPNHELLRNLIEKGATVMGTESPDLLVEEYQLIKHSLPGRRFQDGAGRKAALGRSLLEKRDKYIADRINRTLGPGEVGVIFIGMLHSVQKYLAPDIEVVHPANWSFSKEVDRGSQSPDC